MRVNVESDMYASAVIYRCVICWQKWQEKFRSQILIHTAVWFFGDIWHTVLNINFAM